MIKGEESLVRARIDKWRTLGTVVNLLQNDSECHEDSSQSSQKNSEHVNSPWTLGSELWLILKAEREDEEKMKSQWRTNMSQVVCTNGWKYKQQKMNLQRASCCRLLLPFCLLVPLSNSSSASWIKHSGHKWIKVKKVCIHLNHHLLGQHGSKRERRSGIKMSHKWRLWAHSH